MALNGFCQGRIKLFGSRDHNVGEEASIHNTEEGRVLGGGKPMCELPLDLENRAHNTILKPTLLNVPRTLFTLPTPTITAAENWARDMNNRLDQVGAVPDSNAPAYRSDEPPLKQQIADGGPTLGSVDSPELMREEDCTRGLQHDAKKLEEDHERGGLSEEVPQSDHIEIHPSNATNMDKSDDAFAIREFAFRTMRIVCTRCISTQELTKETFIGIYNARILHPIGDVINISLFCRNCAANVCLGCGAILTTANKPFVADTGIGRRFGWHCNRERLCLVWILLCGFDTQIRHLKALAVSSRSGSDAQCGRSQQLGISGVGYSHEYEELDENDFDVEGMYVAHVDGEDRPSAQTLAILASLLPCGTAASTEFDVEASPLLASMLLRSSVLDKAAELMRNDSLDDANTRYTLYDNLFKFLRVLADGGEAMRALLYDERPVSKAGHDLLRLSYGLPTEMSNDGTECAPPLNECMTDLTSQANVMLQHASTSPAAFKDGEGEQMILLCKNVLECARILNSRTTKAGKKPEKSRPSNLEKDAWQKDVAVVEVSDEQIFDSYSDVFANEARTRTSSLPGRMRRIFTEVSTLRTSLPCGIFVRHGETRADVMKILIVGPKGTPYENGLFEFDLLCGAHYPNMPPKLLIKTTGHGTHSFNPNLYRDGMVCLSLLGTWDGEPWKPGQSTLLQLLVSIQAMIFNDEPIVNEPGEEDLRGSDESRRYSARQWPAVVKYGMLEWLEGKGPAIWAEIVQKHFEMNQGEILECLGGWMGEEGAKKIDSSQLDVEGTEEQDLPSKLRTAVVVLEKNKQGRTFVEDSL